MVNNERTVQTRKSSSEQQQQNAGRIPSRPKCVCKFADWFNHFKCTALHSAIWLTVLALKQIRKSRCSQTKKLYTHSYSDLGILEKTKGTNQIHNL